MNDQLLELLLTYGVVALAPILAGAAVGLPLPASLILLAAGAFAGGDQLSLPSLLGVGLVAAIAGDVAGYWLGRRGGARAIARFGGRIGLNEAALQRADAFLGRWGGAAILLTRFLLTPLGPVINVVAGTARYPARRFLVYDALGEAIWVVGYVSLGYAFSASWDLLASILGDATQALTLLVVVAVLVVLLARAIAHRHDHDQDRGHDAADDGTATEGEPLLHGEPGHAG